MIRCAPGSTVIPGPVRRAARRPARRSGRRAPADPSLSSSPIE
ncbi:hypothetical protein CU044_2180 [Streptomyces sp. L-9-10]|nr:hypothetical protein CU044_2180 [Streptomyces sp. L-9-10]